MNMMHNKAYQHTSNSCKQQLSPNANITSKIMNNFLAYFPSLRGTYGLLDYHAVCVKALIQILNLLINCNALYGRYVMGKSPLSYIFLIPTISNNNRTDERIRWE